jgi:hypothetical protein
MFAWGGGGYWRNCAHDGIRGGVHLRRSHVDHGGCHLRQYLVEHGGYFKTFIFGRIPMATFIFGRICAAFIFN